MQERRHFVRINARLPVAYKALQEEGQCWSVDLSLEGIGLVLKTQMGYGVPLELRIGLPDGQKPINALAKVFWQMESTPPAGDGGKQYRTGLMLTQMAPEDRDRLNLFIVAFLKGLVPRPGPSQV